MYKQNNLAIRRIATAIFIISQFLLQAYAQPSRGINFVELKDWQEVLAKAKAEQKYIFVDVYATWCGPCKMMDNNIYSDSALGAAMNKDFISIKVQMDTTAADNPYIKSWYKDAKLISENAKINAFPTFLYYSLDGELLLKAAGYKDVPSMLILTNFASNPSEAARLTDDLEAYRSGKKDYRRMVDLSRFAKQILKDDKLAIQLAKEYYSGYLTGLNKNEFYNKDHINFISEHGLDLVTVDDKFFQLCYNEPAKIDTILGKGTASIYVSLLVTRDVIRPKLYDEKGKLVTKLPDWKRIRAEIDKRYPKMDVNKFLLDQQISFAEASKQWEHYSSYVSKKFRIYPPKAEDAFGPVNGAAWTVFLNTDNKVALERALRWSNLSIELYDYLQHYDTKANILYRLGRRAEAIQWQEKAVQLNEELTKKDGRNWFPEYKENLEKMLKGQPTWPVK